MNFMWVPLVVASLFKIRVIVIMIASETGVLNEAFRTTNIFTCEAPFDDLHPESIQPHLSFKQLDGVVRLPDKEFRKKPTIEMLFFTGY